MSLVPYEEKQRNRKKDNAAEMSEEILPDRVKRMELEWSEETVELVLIITNKMQRYTIFYITVNALHVSGGFSAHHQELTNCTHSIGYVPSLLAATASVG